MKRLMIALVIFGALAVSASPAAAARHPGYNRGHAGHHGQPGRHGQPVHRVHGYHGPSRVYSRYYYRPPCHVYPYGIGYRTSGLSLWFGF